jgi:hypothetical protein
MAVNAISNRGRRFTHEPDSKIGKALFEMSRREFHDRNTHSADSKEPYSERSIAEKARNLGLTRHEEEIAARAYMKKYGKRGGEPTLWERFTNYAKNQESERELFKDFQTIQSLLRKHDIPFELGRVFWREIRNK